MKSKLYALPVTCLLALFVQSASAQCNNIRYHSFVFSSYTITTVTYSTPYNLQMDIYQPTGDTAKARPLLVLAHGGTFITGSRTDDGTVVSLCENFAKRGYVTCSIDYRLGDALQFLDSTYVINEVIESISDAKAAVRYFYQDAHGTNTYKIDTNKIYIGGNSAGAVMAMQYGYIDSLQQLPVYLQNIVNQNGGIEGNSGNPGYSSKVAGVINLAGGLNLPQLITPGNLPVVSAQGDQDETVPYYCNDPEFGLGGINLVSIPVRLCGLGSLQPLITANIPTWSSLVFPGQGHVPWQSDTTFFDQVDTLVTNFLYGFVGIAENGALNSFCQGTPVKLSAGAGLAYHWNTGATTQAIFTSAGGTYAVTVTGTNGCSAASFPTVINFNPAPSATITANGPANLCQGEGNSVTLAAPPGSTYKWSTGQTTQSITVTAAGYYIVTATNLYGCAVASAPTNVSVNPPPSVSIEALGSTTICQGSDVPLFAQGQAAAYLWSNGATSGAVLATVSGNYIVTITDFNGCTAASAPTVVTVNPAPTVSIFAGGPTTFCAGGNVLITSSPASAYLWSNGSTSQSITASTEGPYNVTVTGANACTAASDTITVTTETLPKAVITASGPTSFCAGQSVTLTASAAKSYKWSNNATTQAITVSATGSYIVTVTNTHACSKASAAKKITVDKPPAFTLTGKGNYCSGGSETLIATKLAGDKYLWSTGASTNSIKIDSGGIYSVTVSNGKCGVSDTVILAPCPSKLTESGKTDFDASSNLVNRVC